jgi:type IX secretion system PorP/SprF family membrane protein
MKYPRILIFIFLSGLMLQAKSQQFVMFTQYMSNMSSINPAYAGSHDMLNIVMLGRKQWLGLAGSPTSETFSINAPITAKKIGVGFSMIEDILGPVKSTGVDADFAFRFNVTPKVQLSLGLKAGARSYSNNLTSLFIIDKQDPLFSADIKSRWAPNFGTGFFLNTDKLYVGLSVPYLLKNSITLNNETNSSFGREERHYYLISGYVWEISRWWLFKPTVLFKYVKNSPISFDMSANFLFSEKLWLSGTYRLGDALGIIAQMKVFRQLWVGYSYDFSLNKMRSTNLGTHEIMLSYDFSFAKYKVKSPRYF